MEDTYATTRDGYRIYVDPDDPRSRSLVNARGDFNPGSLDLWRSALRFWPWEVVVDVGVNYGEMLVGAAMPDGAAVIGFEPNVHLHQFLRRTLAERGLDVDLRAEAVSAAPGTAEFAIDTAWSGTSSLLAERPDESERLEVVEVPVTTLDAVLADTARSFCVKVDVEGFELDVVAGARSAMEKSAQWAMMLEIHHLPRPELAILAQQHPMFLLDRRTRELIRVPGGNAVLLTRLLSSGWLYAQDCLLTSVEIAHQRGARETREEEHA